MYGVATVIAFVLGYVFSAELCAWMPRHAAFTNDGPIRIFVQSNGVHTDLVLPVRSDQFDWRDLFKANDFPQATLVHSADWITLGWGDAGFYLNTPSWSELKFSTALNALSTRAPSVLHVEYLSEATRVQFEMHALQISAAQLEVLRRYVEKSIALDTQGKAQTLHAHYTESDAFFLANGHYSLLRTCNTWTGSGLLEAQIQVGAWTPFARNVMASLPAQAPAIKD